MKDVKKVKRVLFVCTGNTCRSPMAEAILNEKGSGEFEARSAGVFAEKGQEAHPHAIAALKKKGIRLTHESKPLTRSLVDWADLILTMTESHKAQVHHRFPEAHDKIFTLKEYVADPEEKKVWEELQKAHVELEVKRAQIRQERKDGNAKEKDAPSPAENQLAPELEKVRKLEKKLETLDISDPFGSDEETYQNVLAELEDAIDRLIQMESRK